jgi:phosphoglycerol transferase MdoB-like AlkP superfamily enzyme
MDWSISFLLITFISLIVIAGTAFLYFSRNEDLDDKKKALILFIVGTVIFLSFLVTTFKHRNLGFRSSGAEEGTLDIKTVFFGGKCEFRFEPKY